MYKRDGRKISRTFPTRAGVSYGATMPAPKLLAAGCGRRSRRRSAKRGSSSHEAIKAGTVRIRSGDPYKPSAIRAYEVALRLRVLPEFGATRLADLQRADLQDFVERMLTAGLRASTIRKRRCCRCAPSTIGRGSRGDRGNPNARVAAAGGAGRRKRFATPTEAERLLAAIAVEDRAVWATAMYGGLRRGELRALAWQEIDLAAGVIRVELGWDPARARSSPSRTPVGARCRSPPSCATTWSRIGFARPARRRSSFGRRRDPFDGSKLTSAGRQGLEEGGA